MKHFLTAVLIVIVTVCLGIIGCQLGRKTYTLSTGVTPGTHDFAQVGEDLGNMLNQSDFIKVNVVSGEGSGSLDNREYLIKNKADFALMSSDAGSSPDIAVVLPLYPLVVYVVYPKEISTSGFSDLVQNRRIGIGPVGSSSARLAHLLLTYYNVDTTKCKLVNNSFENRVPGADFDVSVILAGNNGAKIKQILTTGKYKILGFDDVSQLQKGSSVEGFCLSYPEVRPYIIPQSCFNGIPASPVLTYALDATLCARRDLDPNIVYKVVDYIVSNREDLSQRNPLFNNLTETYIRAGDSFRYHEGTRMYIDRNFPAFIERFAPQILIVLLVLVLAGAVMFIVIRLNRLGQKRRIESYYSKAILFEGQIQEYQSPDECDKAIKAVRTYKREAMKQLLEEKLAADNNFHIFMNLLEDIMTDIRGKREMLRKRAATNPPEE